MSSVGSSAGLSSASVASQVGVAVVGKALDAAKAQGEAAVSLLQEAAQLQQQLGSSGDPHRGQLLDVVG